MKVLLINPKFPDTYWSFSHALPFEGKRSALSIQAEHFDLYLLDDWLPDLDG